MNSIKELTVLPSREMVKRLYKNDLGQPFILTPSQEEIFDLIYKRKYPRNHIMTLTQYGKSEVVSMAVLTRIVSVPEKWPIVAPTLDKCKIIMSAMIRHIFDNSLIQARFDVGKDESIERIRRERSKNHLTFKTFSGGFGEALILSAGASRTGEDAGNILMGFGAPNLIKDESCLIPDNVNSKAMRMLGGHKDNFCLDIGNPFYRNHFLKTWTDPNYHRLKIAWPQAVDEGRITMSFVEEMRKTMTPHLFKILYECEFPDVEALDSKGYSPLITEEDFARVRVADLQLFGQLRLSVDVAAGGSNYSVIVLSGDNGGRVLYRKNNSDTMSLVGIALGFVKDFKVTPANVFVDVVGVGKGVYDRLREQLGDTINGINVGVAPEDGEDFTNLRAQASWRFTNAVKSGFKIVNCDGLDELMVMRYKVQSDRKIKVITKDELLAEGIQSPDIFDAFMLGFTKKRMPNIKKTSLGPISTSSEFEKW